MRWCMITRCVHVTLGDEFLNYIVRKSKEKSRVFRVTLWTCRGEVCYKICPLSQGFVVLLMITILGLVKKNIQPIKLGLLMQVED